MNGAGTAVFGLVSAVAGVILGHYLTKDMQEDLLRKSTFLALAEKTMETRINLFRDATSLFAEGQRLSYIYRSRPDAERVEFSRLVSCISRESHAAEFCQSGKSGVSDQLIVEVSQLYAKFEVLKVMAAYYFCDETRGAMATLPAGAFWWNAEPNIQKNLLDTMRSEFACDMEKYRAAFDGHNTP